MVTLPSFFVRSRPSPNRMRAGLDSWVLSRFVSVQEMFYLRQKVDFVVWQKELCIRTRQHRFTDLWCSGTSVWKTEEVSFGNMGRHVVRCPGLCRTNTRSVSEEPLQITTLSTTLNCSWCFVQKTDRDWRKQFALGMLFRIEDESTCFFWWSYNSCLSKNQHVHLSCIGNWKSSWRYRTWASFTESQFVVCFNDIQNYRPFHFWRISGDWWQFSGYDEGHCFASCLCGNSFPVILHSLTFSVVFLLLLFWKLSFLVVG